MDFSIKFTTLEFKQFCNIFRETLKSSREGEIALRLDTYNGAVKCYEHKLVQGNSVEFQRFRKFLKKEETRRIKQGKQERSFLTFKEYQVLITEFCNGGNLQDRLLS